MLQNVYFNATESDAASSYFNAAKILSLILLLDGFDTTWVILGCDYLGLYKQASMFKGKMNERKTTMWVR